MSHRFELQTYGIPLSKLTGSLGFRKPKIPSIVARARGKTLNLRESRFKAGVRIQGGKNKVGMGIPREIKRDTIKASGPRDILTQIALSARKRKKVVLLYRKLSTGTTIKREVEPYSIRLKSTKVRGRARYFYGYHNEQGKIESYLVANILGVEEVDTTFTPRWKVEF